MANDKQEVVLAVLIACGIVSTFFGANYLGGLLMGATIGFAFRSLLYEVAENCQHD